MAEVWAPILTILVMGSVVAAWAFFYRRVRQDRADPLVDPSWPSTLQPMPRRLHDDTELETTSSLYHDPDGSEPSRGPDDDPADR